MITVRHSVSKAGHRYFTFPASQGCDYLLGRPYMLRAYFDTQLLMAESNGPMAHVYRHNTNFFNGAGSDLRQ